MTDNDPIEILYDWLERRYRQQPKQLAAAIQEHGTIMSDLDKGMLVGRHVLCKYALGLEEDCEIPAELAGIVVEMRTLEQRLMAETKGNSCIPETGEAEFASRVCRHAKNLSDLETGVLFGLTGVRPEKLRSCLDEAAEANAEAFQALYGYGHPDDQL